jgi:DNA-binding response OmpR family regulator
VRERLLLVEDEDLIGTMVRMNLESEGYDVVWVKGGDEALRAADRGRFDLILLDIGLAGTAGSSVNDGFEVLRSLRARGVGTPVLMLTARAEVNSKVEALKMGADDYLTKPFDIAELLARVRALVRRSQAERELPAGSVVRFGRYEMNLETREAVTNQGKIVLTEKETGLMRLLVSASGQPVSRADVLDHVWGMDVSPSDRTVDNVVVRLRRLFEPDPSRPRHIMTVRGVGYRFQG